MPVCGSPWLFAAYRVLLRRLVPWHPPCALISLIFKSMKISQPSCPLTKRILRRICFVSELSELRLATRSVHFQRTISRPSFLSSVWSFQGAARFPAEPQNDIAKAFVRKSRNESLPPLAGDGLLILIMSTPGWLLTIQYEQPTWDYSAYVRRLLRAIHNHPYSPYTPFLPRKEVIQPHLPIRLPCYDFTPVIGLTLDGWLLAVASPALGALNSHGVTGGVYKARERIHRGMLIRDY